MPADPLKIIGINIEALIRERGYRTVELFAHENDIPKGWLSDVIHGKKNLRILGFIRLADALEVSLDALYPRPYRKK